MLIRNVLIYCVKNARLLHKHPLELNKKGLLSQPLLDTLYWRLKKNTGNAAVRKHFDNHFSLLDHSGK